MEVDLRIIEGEHATVVDIDIAVDVNAQYSIGRFGAIDDAIDAIDLQVGGCGTGRKDMAGIVRSTAVLNCSLLQQPVWSGSRRESAILS
jgi:hypothetical protein